MILVCGEALVDLFVNEDQCSGLTAQVFLGGSPFNVAIGLARLGEAVAFCGGLSSDRFGQALRLRLQREHVDLGFIVNSPRLTTISVIATDSSGQPDYAFHGEGKADREVSPQMLPDTLPSNISALTFGSYTLAVAPVADAYLALARREAASRVISLDPNIRPTVTPDIAQWRQRFNAFLLLADIIKASKEDIAIGYGEAASIDDVVADWFIAGASPILVTHGARGATGYFKNGGKIFAPGRAIVVRDTVGAGDTFHAAILSHLSKSQRLSKSGIAKLTTEELRQAMNYAVAAAAITCARQGADLPTEDEVLASLHLNTLQLNES